MLNRIRNSKCAKITASFLAINLLVDLLLPMRLFALTSGPSQPEVQSFTPVGTSEMVDHFTGDFSYNIPLLQVGSYPINIAYNSGIGMEQEATWVGLGWNLNPGMVNRSLRGLPDEFKGDLVEREMNLKPNRTFKIMGDIGFELFGLDFLKATVGLGIKYNNYTGIGVEQSFNIAVSAGGEGKGSMTAGLGITSSSDGIDIQPNLSFSARSKGQDGSATKLSTNIGVSINSREGLKALSFGTSISAVEDRNHAKENQKAKWVHDSNSGGLSSGSSISFGMNTYVPGIQFPMKNTAVTLSFKPGATLWASDITANISASYSQQKLKDKKQTLPAYGYLNIQEGVSKDKVMLDFNREKDGNFTLNTPNLPLTNLTYDVYSVAGQGVAGTYRPYRNDIGTVFDSKNQTTSDSYSLGVEISGGGIVHAGVDMSVTDVNTTTGKWDNFNDVKNKLNFIGSSDAPGSSALFEPAYFRQVGEKSVASNNLMYSDYGGTEPIRLDIVDEPNSKFEVRVKDKWYKNYDAQNGGSSHSFSNNANSKREKRNQVFSWLSVADAKNVALQKSYYDDIPNSRGHHIGEISILRPDGARYFYGKPLYNNEQQEVTFNISGKSPDCGNGLVTYGSSDNTSNNKNGIDNYFTKTTTPAYAHSHLLTAIVSPDFVDVTQDGPTPDDMGTYTIFKYSNNTDYKWRTPIGGNQAGFNEGFKSDYNDDKANYVYGKKELSYLDTIITKNQIAIFYKSNRKDALGVADENGAKSQSSRMMKLDSIALYSLPDFNANKSNAIPIKKVYFKYDYSLCQNIPNHENAGAGKLTLKEIHFSYGRSKRAKLSPYVFEYSSQNPDYQMKAFDRWGNYKPIPAGASCDFDDPVTNMEYPYTEQSDSTDHYVEAWSLKNIKLPSGGEIKLSYESDDYAYVQNKQAMQMFKIVQANNVAPSSLEFTNPELPNKDNLMSSSNIYNHLVFKLQNPITAASSSAAKASLAVYFNKNVKEEMYFRFLVNLQYDQRTATSGPNDSYEYVSGYAQIDDYGVLDDGGPDYEYAYVKLKNAKFKSNDASPITKTAWSFARVHLPDKAYDRPSINDGGGQIIQVVMDLLGGSVIKNIKEMVEGPDGALYNKNYGMQFYTNKSWIRLLNPDKMKKGGGLRVAKVEIIDNWQDMTGSGSYNSTYGQVYDYTIKENGKTISSGVAEYEPIPGGDENPWRTPIAFGNKKEKMLIPNEEHYLNGPMGESFFPAAGVGYRKVTVQSLASADANDNVTLNATGKIEYEFYTAKDFPVKLKETDLFPKPKSPKKLFKLFKFKKEDYMTVSQGYSIELNDMHGKPKGQKIYQQGGTMPISSVENEYKSDPVKGTLINQAQLLYPDGSQDQGEIGVEIDLVADLRKQETKIISGSGMGNTAGFLIAIIPVFIPTIFASASMEHTKFQSAVMTKVVRRHGIKVKTTTTDMSSKITEVNRIFDSETGQVLMTETINEFDDPVYNMTFPAYWAYEDMGQAYKNLGQNFSLTLSNGSSNSLSLTEYDFVPGDELLLYDVNGNAQKAWIKNVIRSGGSATIQVIAKDGSKTNDGAFNAKVIRSGRKNYQDRNIAQITAMEDPLSQGINNYSSVLNASSLEYSKYWKTYCECLDEYQTANDFLIGKRGLWREKKAYTYLTERNQSKNFGNSNIREDGVFETFSPFWKYDGSKWVKDPNNWTWTAEVTEVSPYGSEIENVDPLGRHSAALFGYQHTLSTAISSNAEYREIAFDGFEDYGYQTCVDHFSWRNEYSNDPSIISSARSHSGRYSLKLEGKSSLKINREIYESCQ